MKQIITWDTVNKGTNVTSFSNNNLTVSLVNAFGSARATAGKVSGKWYWEVKVDINNAPMIGIVSKSGDLNANLATTTEARLYYGSNGTIYPSGVNYGGSYGAGSIIGLALDLDVGTLTYYVNGVSKGVAFNNISSLGEVFPVVSSGSSSGGGTFTANFGATAFAHPIPNDYAPYSGDNNRYLLSSSKVFSSKNEKIIEIDNQQENSFINYGLRGYESISTSTIYNGVTNVVTQSQPLGNGKTFTHTIDLDKWRGKKIIL